MTTDPGLSKEKTIMLKKIISGGQTGADRAALDAAIRLGIPHGGWIPKGRIAEDGPLDAKYKLTEMPTDSYPERTEKNVSASDGTLIISHGAPTGGTEYTRRMVLKHGRQMLHIDLTLHGNLMAAASLVKDWITMHNIEILNVAGPRASKDPRIYALTLALLTHLE
jgi:Circularly permutated YpsA SLOG family